MLPVFLAEKSYFSDALLKFLKNAMTGIGIQNEGEKESSSLFPLFYHILLFVIQVSMLKSPIAYGSKHNEVYSYCLCSSMLTLEVLFDLGS